MKPRHTLRAARRRRKRRNLRNTADLFTRGQRPKWLRRMLEEPPGRLFVVHNPREGGS